MSKVMSRRWLRFVLPLSIMVIIGLMLCDVLIGIGHGAIALNFKRYAVMFVFLNVLGIIFKDRE